MSPYDNVTIFHQDILEVDFEQFKEKYLVDTTRLVVIANLPYYITTPIIMHLIESSLPVEEMVLMMQKVASRLEAKPSTGLWFFVYCYSVLYGCRGGFYGAANGFYASA